MTAKTKKTFTAIIWEKDEHWTFEAKVHATDTIAARKSLHREYPRSSYSIRSVECYYQG